MFTLFSLSLSYVARGQCPELELQFGTPTFDGCEVFVDVFLFSDQLNIDIFALNFTNRVLPSTGVITTSSGVNSQISNFASVSNSPLNESTLSGISSPATTVTLNFDGTVQLYTFSFTGTPGETYTIAYEYAPGGAFLIDGVGTCPTSTEPDEITITFPSVSISGNIQKWPQDVGAPCEETGDWGLDGTQVSVDNEEDPNNLVNVCDVSTDDNGDYDNCDVCPGNDYRITASKDDNERCGIGQGDIDAYLDHLSTEEDPLTELWEYIAGDITGDGLVTAFDMSVVRRMILQPTWDSPYPSWRFIPTTTYNLRKNLPPAGFLPYDPSIHLIDVQFNQNSQNFYGIKAGDLTANCTECNGLMGNVAEDRLVNTIEAYYGIEKDDKGNAIVTLSASEPFTYFHLYGSFQLIEENGVFNELQNVSDDIDVIYVNRSKIFDIDFVPRKIKKGINVDTNEQILSFSVDIPFEELNKLELSDMMDLYASDIYLKGGEKARLKIVKKDVISVEVDFSFSPNPFSDQLQVFDLSIGKSNDKCKVFFYNANGQLIDQLIIDNSVETISTANWPKGLILYEYRRDGEMTSGKLLHL